MQSFLARHERRRNREFPSQGDYVSFSTDMSMVGLYSYAMAYPLEQVLTALSRAAMNYVKVFELRGTSYVEYVVFDGSEDPGDPQAIIDSRSHVEKGEKDYSHTNPRKGYLAVCTALCAGEDEIAAKLAAMIWDPPDADYISSRSEVCTPGDQALAYGLREFMAGKEDEALEHLDRVRPRIRREDRIGYEREMLRAIIRKDASLFIENLDALLFKHDKTARHKYNRQDANYYICLRGLALCKIALERGIVEREILPQNNPYLPLELLDLAKSQ